MELVELKIHGISYSDNSSAAFALILDEVNGKKKLPIVIGGFEAQSIAIALEKKLKLLDLLLMSYSRASPISSTSV